MSSSKRKVKNSNDENQCPSERKRSKIAKTWNLINADEGPELEVLQEMGIGMLDSDESSSSAITANIAQSPDENLNEQTPCITAPVRIHSTEDNFGGGGCSAIDTSNLNQTLESDLETSFIDQKDKLKQINHKSNTSTIEIYTESNISTLPERIQKKVKNNKYGKGRSPLATVACNNNFNNVNKQNVITTLIPSIIPITSNPITSTITTQTNLSTIPVVSATTMIASGTAAVASTSKHIYFPDENFFLYRNRELQQNNGKDPFKKLSDEMILQIFKWLPKKTLVRCSYVCRRFNQLSQDESLWTRLDLGGKSLRSGALGQIVSRGVVILRLAQTELTHPIFDLERFELCPDYRTKLQYLDLSMSVITKQSLKMLLSKCYNLKKLSLEHVPINDQICDEIANNKNLEALNLTMCEGIEQWSVKKLMKELQQLHSLNISWTFLNVESIAALMQNITPNLLRLNIAGCRKNIFDSHIVALSKRCPSLLELDLSDCTGLTSNAVSIVCKFKDLEYLSLSRCYGISTSSYMELNNLPSLAFLDVFGILSDSALQTLQNTFPSLGINKFIHSSVARPTVGTRRTSIWGLRTRD